MALLTLRGRNEDKVRLFIEHIRKQIGERLAGWKDLIIAGPAPAPLVRAETFYRHQIMLRTAAMSRLSAELAVYIQSLELADDLILAVDIDPVNLC